jgi:hypothetical protein
LPVSNAFDSKSDGYKNRTIGFRWPMIETAGRVTAVRGSIGTLKRANRGRRKVALVVLFSIGGLSAHADDLTTVAGKSFHDVQVLSRTSTDLLIQSREGQVQLALNDLKPGDRERFSKDMTKAIELPALTVIGEEKIDLSTLPGQERGERFVEKEIQQQDAAKAEAQKKKVESYQPVQVFKGVTFSLGTTDPKNDIAILPDYVNPEYSRQSPEIVEKDLKVFSNALNNQ